MVNNELILLFYELVLHKLDCCSMCMLNGGF